MRKGSCCEDPAGGGELQTWVNGRIRLDAPADEHAGPALYLAADAADDARRQGVVKPKGVADAQDLARSRSSANLQSTQRAEVAGRGVANAQLATSASVQRPHWKQFCVVIVPLPAAQP